MKNYNKILFKLLIISLFLIGCMPSNISTNYRNYFYAGFSAYCANIHSVEDCTKSINTAINEKSFEEISTPFENNSDAFYVGMIASCLDYEKELQKDCEKKIDQAILDKYFEQLEDIPIYPTPVSSDIQG